jgi:hypothetical protein
LPAFASIVCSTFTELPTRLQSTLLILDGSWYNISDSMVSQKRKAAELVLQSDVVGARLLEAIAC